MMHAQFVRNISKWSPIAHAFKQRKAVGAPGPGLQVIKRFVPAQVGGA